VAFTTDLLSLRPALTCFLLLWHSISYETCVDEQRVLSAAAREPARMRRDALACCERRGNWAACNACAAEPPGSGEGFSRPRLRRGQAVGDDLRNATPW